MDAVQKTAALVRQYLKIDLLDPQEVNPNKMSDREFNNLCKNIQEVGFVDPVFVRPMPNGRYRIIGGFHRYKAGKVLGFEEIPVTVVTDPDFDSDFEKYQIVRMNVIRGQLDANQFLKLYDSLDKKYEAELMAEAFGFTDEQYFKKLIGQMSKALPKNLQGDFKAAAEQIKTIDGLTKLLNQMFTKHGDSLPYGYMMVDFGGKDSVWLRMAPGDRERFLALAEKCVQAERSVDSLFRLFMQSIADPKLEWMFDQLKQFPAVKTESGKIPLEN
jgi:ParB/RepB/Spo0J family partition protein